MQTTLQLDYTAAIAAKNDGIRKAEESTEAKAPGWSEKCYALLLQYIKIQKEFTSEEFRKWVEDKIESPNHNRSFGGIMLRARIAGLIEEIGYRPTTSVKSHRCPSKVWLVK